MGWKDEPNKISIKDIKAKYIGIKGMQTGSDVMVTIDANISGKKYLIIIDQDGTEIKFNSMIEALNYFYNYGYELDSAFGIAAGLLNQDNYVLKRKV